MRSVSRKRLTIAQLSLPLALLLLSAGVTFLVASYVFAAKKVAQCNRLMETIHEGHAKVLAFKARDAISTHQLASELEGLTLKLGVVELVDPKLRSYRRGFVKVYRELSEEFRTLGQAWSFASEAQLTQSGQEKVKQAISDVQSVGISATQSAEEADRLAEGVNRYCHLPSAAQD